MKRFVKTATLYIVMALVAVLFCAPVQAIGTTSNAQHIVGYGSVGEGVGKQTTIVDFANANLDGFFPFAGTESLNFGTSDAWKTTVLKMNLASPNDKMGIQKDFSDASILKDASTLSVQLIAQAQSYVITLRLSGVDNHGAPLTWEAHTTATTNHWQTVTFDISSFTTLVHSDAPVSITLLASADNEDAIGATWMIKSLYVNTHQPLPEFLLPTASAACGFVVGFTLFFVIYRTTCNKNRRLRRGEER